MTIKHSFTYTMEPGRTFVGIDQWVATLPEAEQTEYAAALARQFASRQVAIDAGDLTLEVITGVDGDAFATDVNYIWKDKDTAVVNKLTDEVWLKYWYRWLSTTGATMTTVETPE